LLQGTPAFFLYIFTSVLLALQQVVLCIRTERYLYLVGCLSINESGKRKQ